MKKILFVSATEIFIHGGGAQATHAYLDATLDVFGRENVTVMLGSQVEIPTEYSDLKYIKIKKRSRVQSWWGFFTGALSRMTNPLISYMRKNHNQYDLCIINGSLTGGKAVKIVEKLGVSTIVIFHNFEVEYHKDNKSILCLRGHYMGAIKRAEMLSYKNCSLGLFLTRSDVVLFNNTYGKSLAKSYIIGTFDYKNKLKERLIDEEKEYSIVISGSLSDYQTYVGIKDFFDNYLNIAEELLPGVSIIITGRSPSPAVMEFQKMRPDAITIIPNPEDILSVVRSAAIYVCPTCIGGGLKLRAMDGLKSGLPVLAHEVSARGYDYYFSKDYFKFYKDSDSFRIGMLELLDYIKSNPDSQKTINRDYYEYFGYGEGVNRFKEAVNLIV